MIVYDPKHFSIIIAYNWYILLTGDKTNPSFIEEDGLSDEILSCIRCGDDFSMISCCTWFAGLTSFSVNSIEMNCCTRFSGWTTCKKGNVVVS